MFSHFFNATLKNCLVQERIGRPDITFSAARLFLDACRVKSEALYA